MLSQSGQNKIMQFPSISRIITENNFILRLNKSWKSFFAKTQVKKGVLIISGVLTFLLILVLSMGIILLSFNIYKNINKVRNINSQREDLQSQINFWTSVTNKYPGYKDAYFRIAVLEYNLGDFKKAEMYNSKALVLDPNYKDALILNKILLKK